MTNKAFERIAAGLEAAIEYAEGCAKVEDYRVHVPTVDAPTVDPPTVDVAALRRRLDLSQSLFAARFGFAPADVRSWESGGRQESAMRAYLRVIERDPDAVMLALNGPSERSTTS